MGHKVAHRVEVKVERELVADFKRVAGKSDALARLNRNIRSNEHVQILKKDPGWISLVRRLRLISIGLRLVVALPRQRSTFHMDE